MNRTLTPEELCTLVDTHFSTLLVFARQFSISAAEDLVQDAFLQLVKRSQWEGRPDQPLAWLFQVVRNAAIDRHRKETRQQRHEETLQQDENLRFLLPNDAAEKTEEIEAMLALLTPQKREIVVARIWGSLSFDEIAVLLGLSRTTAFRHYTEALETMKRRTP